MNLAPADLRKEGPAYDLPIAVALLLPAEQMTADRLTRYREVSCRGRFGAPRQRVLPMAHVAWAVGYDPVFVPRPTTPKPR